jgi:hypothetical protein
MILTENRLPLFGIMLQTKPEVCGFAGKFGRKQSKQSGGALEHDPEKACPGLDPGGNRFSEKIMLKPNIWGMIRERGRFSEQITLRQRAGI